MPSSSSDASSPDAYLLVDGYNMIGAWPFLRDARDRHSLETARQDLVNLLSDYAAFQGFATEVVFDAQYNSTVGSREAIDSYVWVRYTDPHQTADTYIEKACADFHSDIKNLKRRLIVATSDNAQRQTVTGYGAEWRSAAQLLLDIEFSSQNVKHKLRNTRQPSRRLLSNTIDPIVQQRLARMRFGLFDQ